MATKFCLNAAAVSYVYHTTEFSSSTQEAVPMACKDAGIGIGEVEYFAVCTTTGFLSPGLSAHLAAHLGLSPYIARVDIVGMGCHAGLNTMCTVMVAYLQISSLYLPLPPPHWPAYAVEHLKTNENDVLSLSKLLAKCKGCTLGGGESWEASPYAVHGGGQCCVYVGP